MKPSFFVSQIHQLTILVMYCIFYIPTAQSKYIDILHDICFLLYVHYMPNNANKNKRGNLCCSIQYYGYDFLLFGFGPNLKITVNE